MISPFGPLAAVLLLTSALAAAPQGEPDRVDFATQIWPILQARCIDCHGADEPEADLRLDVREGMFPEDAFDPPIIAGKPDESLLFERLVLPADDPDIMPADGDPLSKEQIGLIRAWIEQGAVWPEGLELHTATAPVEDRLVLPELDAAGLERRDATLSGLRERGALALPIAANTPAVEVGFALLGESVTDADLDRLAGLESTLVWLDLARTAVTDAGLAKLTRFGELRRLNVSNTKVGDAGLAHIAKLTNLEYLNLYGTKVTDAGLPALHGQASLRKVFLWQSGASETGIAALVAALPDARIDAGKYVEVIQEVARATTPINAKCLLQPKKDVDPAYIFEHDGVVVGFCCGKCRASFADDPNKHADKLAAAKAAADGDEGDEAGATAPKPHNDVCPVSKKPVDPAHTAEHDGKVFGFCCAKCKAAFAADPAKFGG